MLSRIFDLDNPVMRFLGDLFDLLMLNLITVALCIPIITAGPALTALHYMTLKMARGEQTYILAPYFKSFKENFRQSAVIGLIYIAAIAVFAIDLWIFRSGVMDLPQVMRIMIVAVAIVLYLLFLWVIPLQAHFENTIRGTFRNSTLMSLAHFPRTLAMAAIWLLPIACAVISYQLWPIVMMFGLSAPAFLCAKVYSPAFKQFEPEVEEETPDEYFTMDDADLDAFAQDLSTTFGAQDDESDEK